MREAGQFLMSRRRAGSAAIVAVLMALSCGRPTFTGPLASLAEKTIPRDAPLNCPGFFVRTACWVSRADTLAYFELDGEGRVLLLGQEFSVPAPEATARLQELEDSLSLRHGTPAPCALGRGEGTVRHVRWNQDLVGVAEIGFWLDAEPHKELRIRIIHFVGETDCVHDYGPPFRGI